MKINSFDTLYNILMEGDNFSEDDIANLTIIGNKLRYINSSVFGEISKDFYRFGLYKSEQGKSYYHGRSKQDEMDFLFIENNDKIFTVSRRTSYSTPGEFFTAIDPSTVEGLNPEVRYYKTQIRVEEDGYLKLMIEELILNGEVVSERIINYQEHDFGNASDSPERRLFLCLSDFGFGGVEIVYDQNHNVLDVETIGDIKLDRINRLTKEEIKANIKTSVMDAVLKEAFRIKKEASIPAFTQK